MKYKKQILKNQVTILSALSLFSQMDLKLGVEMQKEYFVKLEDSE